MRPFALLGKQLAEIATDEFTRERHLTWKKFSRHRPALAGAIVLVLISIAAVFAPLLSSWNPNISDALWQGTPLSPGFGGHILGSDELGRDLLTRLFFGARISLTVALSVVFLEVALGALVGAIAGFYGRWVDYGLMRITDVFLSIPLLPVLLVITGIIAMTTSKAALSLVTIVLIIGLLSWMPVARLVRGAFLSLREKEFCEAARAIGGSDWRIILRHMLPNAMAPIIVQATLDVANIIILESTLSFLGNGIQPPTASWGNMLANAQENIQIAPWAAICPGLCILITVLAFNYMGDGLRDALDPNVR